MIRVFVTGGTFDKTYDEIRGRLSFGDSHVPEMLRLGRSRVELTVEKLMMIDSLDMSDADRQLIRERVAACEAERVLITHGTDTMAETAKALTGIANKTIVLTGSMQPARFRNTDAVFNVGFALGAVQALPPGVYLAINGRIFDAGHVRKNRERQQFEETDN